MFTIYTKLGAQTANPSYFKRLRQSDAGPARTMLGRAIPNHAAGHSYIIVRVAHKTERQVYYTTRKQSRRVKTYYATQRVEYVVATIGWHDGQVTEISAHATKAEALAARHSLI